MKLFIFVQAGWTKSAKFSIEKTPSYDEAFTYLIIPGLRP